jgi:hypothetical protein
MILRLCNCKCANGKCVSFRTFKVMKHARDQVNSNSIENAPLSLFHLFFYICFQVMKHAYDPIRVLDYDLSLGYPPGDDRALLKERDLELRRGVSIIYRSHHPRSLLSPFLPAIQLALPQFVEREKRRQLDRQHHSRMLAWTRGLFRRREDRRAQICYQ